jgi:hypothetical protein
MINDMNRKIAETLAVFLFFVIFPGYYFYHYFAAAGLIPLLIKGWFVIGCFVTAAFLVPAILTTRPFSPQQLTIHTMFLALSSMIAGNTVYHYFLGEGFQRGSDIAINSFVTLSSLIALYLLGYFTPDSTALRNATAFSLFLMAFLAIGSIDPTTLQFIATERFNAPAGGAGYQGFALAFVTTALMALGMNWKSPIEPFILAVGFATLLISGSRSDFYGYFVISAGWVVLLIIKKRYLTATIGIAASVVLTAAILLLPPMIAEYNSKAVQVTQPTPSVKTAAPITSTPPSVTGPQNHGRSSDYILDIARQTAAIDISQSESWSFRKQMFDRGWDDIKSSPFWGVYAGQTKDGHSIGSYIHNGLSAWRQFGILAFLIYVALCAAPPFIAAHQIVLKGKDDRLWIATLYFGAFCLLLVIAAKSIFWPLPALTWGLLAGRFRSDGLVNGSEIKIHAVR